MSEIDKQPTDLVEVEITKKQPPANHRGKGGKGARSKRTDSRRAEKNSSIQTGITSSAENRLGLKESTELASLKPASSIRPGGVHTNLLGYAENITAMLRRMRSIAARPLANLLTDANLLIYRRVAQFVVLARIVSAQDKLSSVAGVPLDLVGTITTDTLRLVEGKCKVIPNYLAWMLSNYGLFEFESAQHVPLLQTEGMGAIADGNYSAIAEYVAAHAQVGQAVPADERPLINRLANILPNLQMTNAHIFNAAAIAAWHEVNNADWTVFTEINASLAEQKLCTRDFSIMAATGTNHSIVRFPLFQPKDDTINYYCTVNSSMTTERVALILRSGIDEFLPAPRTRDRFISNPNTALVSGNDIPGTFLSAQLNMLSKLAVD